MKKTKSIIAAICGVLLIVGCGDGKVDMVFGDVVTIGSDVPTCGTGEEEPLALPGIGYYDILIRDSILFLSTGNSASCKSQQIPRQGVGAAWLLCKL